MKLSTKMVLTFSVTTALVIGASVTLLYAKSYRLLINVAEKQATMLTGIVEGQNSGAFNDEDSSGTNPQFQQFLTSLKSSIPALVEMNIYKISLGQVVASTHTDAIGKPVDPEDSAAAQQDTTVVLLERDENNDLVIDVTAPLHGSGTIDYAIGTKFSLADETAFLNTFLVYSIILAVLAIAVVVVVAMVLARRVRQPIDRSARLFADMSNAEGDLTQRLPARRVDEIGTLERNFNAFMEKLRAIVISLGSAGSSALAISDELASNSGSAAAASEEIAGTMKSMNDQAGHLHDEISETNNTVKEIDALIGRVSELIDDQAAAVHQSSASVEEMVSNVASIEQNIGSKRELLESLTERAHKGESSLAENVRAMGEINESTSAIYDLIGVINGFAAQTNILAMNAAIEAAHAGDAGRGFAVVADEIRNLAELTSKNAKEISVTLKGITAGISSTTQLLNDSSGVIADVLTGIGEVTTSLTETLNGLKEISLGNTQIMETISKLNSMTHEVRDSGVSMKDGTGRIETALERILSIAAETRNGISDITSRIDSISGSVRAIADLSERNASVSHQVEAELGKFTT